MTNDIMVLDDFTAHVGTEFTVRLVEGGQYPLTLVKAEGLPVFDYPGRKRDAFHLLFNGPGPGYLPQQIHILLHDHMGELPIGLVPVGTAGDGFVYEAVFN